MGMQIVHIHLNYIYINDNSMLRLTKQLSLMSWIKTSYAKPFASILNKMPAGGSRAGYGLCINDYNKLRSDIMWDHSQNNNSSVLTSSSDMTDGNWHFVGVTYDDSIVNLYVDGVIVNSGVYTTGAQTNNEPLLIGWDRNTWLSDRHFNGIIDEIRIYNRALSKEEFQYLAK